MVIKKILRLWDTLDIVATFVKYKTHLKLHSSFRMVPKHFGKKQLPSAQSGLVLVMLMQGPIYICYIQDLLLNNNRGWGAVAEWS